IVFLKRLQAEGTAYRAFRQKEGLRTSLLSGLAELAVDLLLPLKELAQRLIFRATEQNVCGAFIHLRRRHAKSLVIATDAVPKPLEREEEECAVLAVIELRNPNWAAHASAEIVLFVDRLSQWEEPARVQRVVAQEVIGRAMNLIRATLGDEGHHA